MSNKQTYVASDVVNVDEETANFITESDEWAKTTGEKLESYRRAKTNQALFKLGVLAFLNEQQPDVCLYENSDAYFQGYDTGRRIANKVNDEAVKKFPANRTDKF